MQVLIAILAVVAALVFGLVAVGRSQPENNEPADPAERVYAVTYRIEHLAVWIHSSNEYDPAILIALIKATVDPKAWEGASRIEPGEPGALIISTKASNHSEIGVLLEKFRKAEKKA